MGLSPPSNGTHPAAAFLPVRRRRAPTSQVERARRRQFGNEWGKFMRQIGQQLQEASTE